MSLKLSAPTQATTPSYSPRSMPCLPSIETDAQLRFSPGKIEIRYWLVGRTGKEGRRKEYFENRKARSAVLWGLWCWLQCGLAKRHLCLSLKLINAHYAFSFCCCGPVSAAVGRGFGSGNAQGCRRAGEASQANWCGCRLGSFATIANAENSANSSLITQG